MNPVIGLDVSKGESHAQAFINRGITHGKIFRFEHNFEGLISFLNYMQDLESFTGLRPAVVLEATTTIALSFSFLMSINTCISSLIH